MMYEAPTAPQNVGGVLDDWLRLFRHSYRYCWILALIAALANAYQQYLLIPSFTFTHTSLIAYFSHLGTVYSAPRVLVTDLLFWLFLMVLYGALIVQQLELVRGRVPGSVGAALNASLSRFGGLLFGAVLLALLEGIPVGAIGLIAAALLPLYGSALTWLVLGACIVVLAVFLIYVSVRVQLWAVALFDTGCGGATAIAESWRLIRGHWWRTTSINFVAVVVIWILGLVVSLFAAVIAGVFSATGGALSLLSHLRLIAAIGTLARMLSMPLLTAVWIAIYQDLKLRREGGDLATRAEALGG